MERRRQSGKTVAAGVTVVAAVGLATLAAIFFRGGGTGSGAGSGTGPASGTGTGTGTGGTGNSATLVAQTQPAAPELQRPLRVTIRESSYLVGGREVDLNQLGELAAKVPAGSGPAVMIERDPSSRAKAEEDLERALDERQIPHASD